MKPFPRLLLSAAILVLSATAAPGQAIGPTRGTLMIVGGGGVPRYLLDRFLELAGGTNAPVVVIPTAGEAESYGQDWAGLQLLKDAGATNLTVIHTRDRNVANTAAFVAPIRQARAVWFPGGRQWRLADSYLNTLTQTELKALLDRGGIIGGTSAGATILGSYLARGDTKTADIMMGDHEVGFGFVRNVAIDQHLLRRNRQFDLIPLIEKRPELLGIGIDESTAIMVQGDTAEVFGASYVAIYDNHRTMGPGGRFYLLRAGDRYDLRTREALRPAPTLQPLQGPIKQDWPKP